ncbi:MAG: hypothetical protein ACJA0U_000783 [Salibacteraceae bacterium]|jgi:hypothetical protein
MGGGFLCLRSEHQQRSYDATAIALIINLQQDPFLSQKKASPGFIQKRLSSI